MQTKGKIVHMFKSGQPRLLIIGEAPGPRGASLSGYPFWGDVSGKQIYALFDQLGLLVQKVHAPVRKDGLPLGKPPQGNYAISNAFDRMPWDDKNNTFRSPTTKELKSQAARIHEEITTSGAKLVLAVGLPAAKSIDFALKTDLVPNGCGLAQALMGCLEQNGVRWRQQRIFLTYHPSYGQWQREMTGKLHAQVVKKLTALL